MKRLLLATTIVLAVPGVALASTDAGKQLYDQVCSMCHQEGLAGAPKTGNHADWAPLIEQGMDSMLNIAINGKGAMPPRGASNADDQTLKEAIEYMIAPN